MPPVDYEDGMPRRFKLSQAGAAKVLAKAALKYYASPEGIVAGGAALYGAHEKYDKTYKKAKKMYKKGEKIYEAYSKMPYTNPRSQMVLRNLQPQLRLRKPKTKLQRVQNDIKKLKRFDKAGMGTHIHRQLEAKQLIALLNEQGVGVYGNGGYISQLETVLANLQYFNPAVPGTLTTADLSAGTYSKNIDFKSISTKIDVRNNYQTALDYTIYLCKVRDDTSTSPFTAYTSGLSDGGNLSSVTDLGQYPTDYNLVTDLWHLKVAKKGRLQPGQEVTCSHSEVNIEYDPSTADTQSLNYQKEYKAYMFMVVIKGVLGHDTAVANEVTTLSCGVDIGSTITYVIQYNAGANIKRIHVGNSMDNAFTNGGVASNKPASDNQGYSVA